MRLAFKVSTLLSAGLALAGYDQPDMHTDSISSHRTENQHVFHCRDLRATLRYTEAVDVDNQSAALADRWRIRGASLSVAGRTISPGEQRQLANWLHRFAWIERATMRCNAFNRDLRFNLEGMDAVAWAAFGEGQRTQRPSRTSLGFTVSGTGSVTLD